MDYLALRGVKQVIELLPKNIKITKIIPTFYNRRTRKSKEISEDLENFFKDKVTKPIRANVRLSECSSFHKTIFEYGPKSRDVKEQTRKGWIKPSIEISPNSLQNPTDSDATYRKKGKKKHIGYTGNIVEKLDDKNRMITGHDLQKIPIVIRNSLRMLLKD